MYITIVPVKRSEIILQHIHRCVCIAIMERIRVNWKVSRAGSIYDRRGAALSVAEKAKEREREKELVVNLLLHKNQETSRIRPQIIVLSREGGSGALGCKGNEWTENGSSLSSRDSVVDESTSNRVGPTNRPTLCWHEYFFFILQNFCPPPSYSTSFPLLPLLLLI